MLEYETTNSGPAYVDEYAAKTFCCNCLRIETNSIGNFCWICRGNLCKPCLKTGDLICMGCRADRHLPAEILYEYEAYPDSGL